MFQWFQSVIFMDLKKTTEPNIIYNTYIKNLCCDQKGKHTNLLGALKDVGIVAQQNEIRTGEKQGKHRE